MIKILSLLKPKKKNNIRIESTTKNKNIEPLTEQPLQFSEIIIPEQTTKPKTCYIYFKYNNALVRLIPPYYRFLPNDKIIIFWKKIYGSHEKGKTILPKEVFMKNGSLTIANNTLITVFTHDLNGNEVHDPESDEYIEAIKQLQTEIEFLRNENSRLKKELLEVKSQRIEEFSHAIAQELYPIRKLFYGTNEHFNLEINKKVRQNDEEGE